MAIKYIGRYFHYDDRFLSDEPTFIECGTYSGANVKTLVQTFPKATVIAVEASPESFKLLCKNLEEYDGNENVILENSAVAGREGETEFYVYEGKPSSNSIYPRHEIKKSVITELLDERRRFSTRSVARKLRDRLRGRKPFTVESTEKVRATTIRSMMRRHGLESVDLIMANIEGAERDIIEELLEDEATRGAIKQLCLSMHERVLGRDVVQELHGRMEKYYSCKKGEGKWACHLFINRQLAS